MTWTKPDGNSLIIYIGNPSTNVNYEVSDPSISPWIQKYVGGQTGTTPSGVTVPQEMAALFDQDGKGLMSNPVLQGTFRLRVDFIGSGQGAVQSDTFLSINGKSYGLMGTDLYGRP